MATTQDILKGLQETMDTAEYGYDIFVNGKPPEKNIGLRNLVVFGRAVTNVLQKLRSLEPEFDIWYEKYKKEMEKDPLMKYFYNLRSEILKEGQLKVAVGVHIKHLNLPQDPMRLGPPPPNVKSFFIGDHLGGSGWEIQLPDGSTEKFYIELPSEIGSAILLFPNPPSSFMGKKIRNASVPMLSRMYLDYLQNLVRDAKVKFGAKE